jgi:hypothetical protein
MNYNLIDKDITYYNENDNIIHNKLDEYLSNYENYNKKIIYHFDIGYGGIGDYIKYFIYLLSICIKHKIQIYLKNKSLIEKYLKLKYEKMYLNDDTLSIIEIKDLNDIFNIKPDIFYKISPFHMYVCNDFIYNIPLLNETAKIFYFTNDIILYANKLIDSNQYISIHLRLGDKYLETDKNFIICLEDERKYDENALFNYIETHCNKNLLFFCDNNAYKLKIKSKYPFIKIFNYEIGHTSLINTTETQIFNTIIDFYIISNSQSIYMCSESGYPRVASKFNNIPIINI